MTLAYQIPPTSCDGSYAAAAALAWQASPEFIFEEKIDGTRALLQIRPHGAPHNFLTGRRIVSTTGLFAEMQDTHPAIRDHAFPDALADVVLDGELAGGVYHYFDLLVLHGRSLINRPLRERRAELARLAADFPAWLRPVRSSTSPDFFRGILAAGGEGIVRKKLSETYGFSWSKAKVRETFDVVIIEVDVARQTMTVGQWSQGALVPQGEVTALTAAEAAQAAGRVGEAVEIICQYRNPEGRFFHAYFLRFRPDKGPEECVFDVAKPRPVRAPAKASAPAMAPAPLGVNTLPRLT
jgi:ATP-dependent DNA ligase